jgi:prephenate dehydratase
MKVAIQGEPGSFSHEAAKKLNADAEIVPFSLSAEVFTALANGTVEAAVIPIENSLAGSVLEHFDLLLAHDVQVERETLLRIRHNLIALKDSSIDDIDRVYSHPVALAQCRLFLAAHPKMQSVAFYDTAGSVKQLVELSDHRRGSDCQRGSSSLLWREHSRNPTSKTIRRTLRDSFSCGRRGESVADPESNKISIAFSVENRPGSLVAALGGIIGYRHQSDQDRVQASSRQTMGVHLLCGLPDSLGR